MDRIIDKNVLCGTLYNGCVSVSKYHNLNRFARFFRCVYVTFSLMAIQWVFTATNHLNLTAIVLEYTIYIFSENLNYVNSRSISLSFFLFNLQSTSIVRKNVCAFQLIKLLSTLSIWRKLCKTTKCKQKRYVCVYMETDRRRIDYVTYFEINYN